MSKLATIRVQFHLFNGAEILDKKFSNCRVCLLIGLRESYIGKLVTAWLEEIAQPFDEPTHNMTVHLALFHIFCILDQGSKVIDR